MAQGLLEVAGTLDISQFWPAGTSDADTTKILVKVGAGAFRYRKDAASNFKITHVFDDAEVKGKTTKPVLNSKGEITVRLQGIDAPELHYRPVAELKKAEQTEEQHELYLKWNLEYRQPLAESATIALTTLLQKVGSTIIPCTVRSFADEPNDVFDTYGRLVGEIFVKVGSKEVSINTWLVENGWALPAFYNSMSDTEITTLTDAADRAYENGLGVWPELADKVGRLNFEMEFRGKGEPPANDSGLVVVPKLFRRLAAFEVNKKARMASGSFGAYLAKKKDVCFETSDFLEQGSAAAVRTLDEFVDGDGTILFWPEGLVFKDSPSRLIVPGGGKPRW